MTEFENLLVTACTGRAPITNGQAERLARHYELLMAWNQRLNLTRITEVGAAVERHYCEGIVLASHLPVGELRIADFGSGAGFPGIPVAVVRPECQVTLIESHQRKAVFLREATRGWENVRVLAGRAEDASRLGVFDWVVARAVRWQEVVGASLGRNYALLLGRRDAEEASRHQGFTWNIIDLGLAPDSVLLVGTA